MIAKKQDPSPSQPTHWLLPHKARLSVATSSSPTGPFTLVTEKAAIEVGDWYGDEGGGGLDIWHQNGEKNIDGCDGDLWQWWPQVSGGGDFTLLVDANDDNGTAYLAYGRKLSWSFFLLSFTSFNTL